ncbi:hypothetical protein K5D57_09865 [Pseudomonas cichorii]|nr:hypothetical protein [Pseudomonas cichorii]
MDPKELDFKRIWRQTQIPVVYKREKAPLMVKAPFAADNRAWLRGSNARHKPKWNDKYLCWETPASWFDDTIKKALGRFKQVYVIQLHKEHQKCARACWDAQGIHCECHCMGANHGSGHPAGRWYEVSDTFAFHVGPRHFACRLLTIK